MSAYDYCRDKVALPGSSLYYSLLFVARETREALTALHAAAEEWRAIAEQCTDENVARAKLGWWAEEIQRAVAGSPRHPVMQVLAPGLRRAKVDTGRLFGVLDAFAEHQSRETYMTFAELESHYERVADLTGCMAAELCGCENAATLEASRHLGVALALTDVARRPQNGGGRRATDLPAELLTQFQVAGADLAATHTSPALREAIRSVADGARLRLRRALDEMPRDDHARQRGRRALAEMTLAQLGAMKRGDYAMLEQRLATTPLRKLWIAWKHRQT